jgi:hypothetical protein
MAETNRETIQVFSGCPNDRRAGSASLRERITKQKRHKQKNRKERK